jgi:predicted CopG family antitoxin
MSDTTTTIQISKRLRDELAKHGSKDDTFDTIIRRLLERKGDAE